MFRKNHNERSNSASTKLITSKKLPFDFFTPTNSTFKKQNNSQSQLKVRQIKSIDKKSIKDQLLFTFNQTEHIKKHVNDESCLKIKKMNSSKLIKLPPVLLRINRENRMGGNQDSRMNKMGKNQNLSKVWDRVLVQSSG